MCLHSAVCSVQKYILTYEVSLKFPCHGIGLGGPAPFFKVGWRGGEWQRPFSFFSRSLRRSGFFGI